MSVSLRSLYTYVLVVDDDPHARDTLRLMLHEEGYLVHCTGLGRDALERASHQSYSVVLLDIKLPDLNGLAVLERLQGIDPTLPVVLLTGYATVENTIIALNRGAFAYITKPYNPEEIRALVRRAVEVRTLAVKSQQVERALRESEARFRSVVESAPDAIILSDDQGRIISWNKSAQRFFGYSEGEVLGRPLTLLMPTRYREAHQRGLTRLRTTNEPCVTGRTIELHGLRKDGGEFPLELSLAMWRTESGTFFSGIIRDITERKQAQDQLIQAEKLASLGTLVSGMAHEINNPIQGILGMAEIIQEETDPARIKEFSRDIALYSKHVAAVVRDLVCYARPASLDEETSLDLCERLMEAIKMVRRGPDFGLVQVATEFHATPKVRARRTEIDQVFVNLISNAVQAMEGKGTLTLTVQQGARDILVRVSDTGCGIPRSLLGKVFDPFFTTKDPGKGTGLGLSIAYKIVAKYGGRISIQSEEGRGTSFTVLFPVREPSTQEVSHEPQESVCREPFERTDRTRACRGRRAAGEKADLPESHQGRL
jgi:PAS domain S-box-containing protein